MISARVWIVSVGTAVAMAASSGAAQADEDQYFRVDAAPETVVMPRPHHSRRQAWYDFGLVRTDITATSIGTPGSNQQIVANTIRFGIGVKLSRHFYAGGDTDFGTISDSVTDAGGVGRSSTMPTSVDDSAIRGSTGAIRGLAGIMAGTRGLTGAAELAAGYRIESSDGRSIMGVQTQEEMVVEGRGRLSLFLTPVISVGAVAGVDLRDHRDVSFGLTLGLHLYAWNHH